jgi:hypothetical protein
MGITPLSVPDKISYNILFCILFVAHHKGIEIFHIHCNSNVYNNTINKSLQAINATVKYTEHSLHVKRLT